jgi:hypothetical protein
MHQMMKARWLLLVDEGRGCKRFMQIPACREVDPWMQSAAASKKTRPNPTYYQQRLEKFSNKEQPFEMGQSANKNDTLNRMELFQKRSQRKLNVRLLHLRNVPRKFFGFEIIKKFFFQYSIDSALPRIVEAR